MDDEQTNKRTTNNDLVYPELSYKIVGLLFKINDQIGFGQSEKVYTDSFEILLKNEGMLFSREYYYPLKIDGVLVAKRYFDFLIDDKIIIELKVGDYKYKEACSQLFQYLKASGKKLGIIARYTRNGVKIKRIPCFY